MAAHQLWHRCSHEQRSCIMDVIFKDRNFRIFLVKQSSFDADDGDENRPPAVQMGGGISRQGHTIAAPVVTQLEKQIGITSTLCNKVNHNGSAPTSMKNILSLLCLIKGQIYNPSLSFDISMVIQVNHLLVFSDKDNGKTMYVMLYLMCEVSKGRVVIRDKAGEVFEESPERFEACDVFLDVVYLRNVTSTNRNTLVEHG